MVPELPGRETAIRTLVAALDDTVLARSLNDAAEREMKKAGYYK